MFLRVLFFAKVGPNLAYCSVWLDGPDAGAAADVVAFEFAVERGAADAEHAAGEGFVAFDLLEDALDGGAFDVFEIGGGERSRGSAVAGTHFGCGGEIGNQFGRGF